MSDKKFEKKFRLRSLEDFKKLKTGSFSYKKASLIVYYKKNSLDRSRIGLSTPKKIGKAHERNRIKRLIREFFRTSSYKFLKHDILLVVSWSKNLLLEKNEIREAVLVKNLHEFFNFLEDEKLRGNE